MTDYTREDLIRLCEQAVVPHDEWLDRDSPSAQEGVGKAWAFLRAGCDFRVLREGKYCVTDEQTVWIEVDHDTFGTFDWGAERDTETFYLPTAKRLQDRAGRDWY